jgi:hypothetical protein
MVESLHKKLKIQRTEPLNAIVNNNRLNVYMAGFTQKSKLFMTL